MAKAPYLGVVSFGRFVPDSGSGSVTMLTAIDRHGQLTLKQLRLSVLNEMHTNSYSGPRLTGQKTISPDISLLCHLDIALIKAHVCNQQKFRVF